MKEAARNPTTTEIKATQHEQQEYYWTTDPISRKPLAQPIVSDSNGKLYNKDTILEYLIPSDDGANKAEAEAILQGSVKSLRDVVEVHFDVATAETKEGWRCPVTGDSLGPGSKAVYLVPCGHAFSGGAIKEVSGERCLQCNETYASNDVIPILPTAATDIARLTLRVKTLKDQGLSHSLKKSAKESKKRKKREEKEDVPLLVSVAEEGVKPKDASSRTTGPRTSTPLSSEKDAVKSSNIKNTSTASLTAKVMQEQEQRKKQKMDNDNLRSLFSNRDPAKPHGKSSDFMTRGYSIPANAKR